jgi:hybrid cluster-associated redox disulfide protein
MALQITKDTLIGEMLQQDMGIAAVLMGSGMHCVGCPASQMESLEDACKVHGMNPDEVLDQINKYLEASK